MHNVISNYIIFGLVSQTRGRHWDPLHYYINLYGRWYIELFKQFLKKNIFKKENIFFYLRLQENAKVRIVEAKVKPSKNKLPDKTRWY